MIQFLVKTFPFMAFIHAYFHFYGMIVLLALAAAIMHSWQDWSGEKL